MIFADSRFCHVTAEEMRIEPRSKSYCKYTTGTSSVYCPDMAKPNNCISTIIHNLDFVCVKLLISKRNEIIYARTVDSFKPKLKRLWFNFFFVEQH